MNERGLRSCSEGKTKQNKKKKKKKKSLELIELEFGTRIMIYYQLNEVKEEDWNLEVWKRQGLID